MIRNNALEDQGRVRAVETGESRSSRVESSSSRTKQKNSTMRFFRLLLVFPFLFPLAGGCPHAAIREDISANMHALEELQGIYETELLFVESGGDNLAGESGVSSCHGI